MSYHFTWKKERESLQIKLMPGLELVPSSQILHPETQTMDYSELVQYKIR